jgi:hypothetical protein
MKLKKPENKEKMKKFRKLSYISLSEPIRFFMAPHV